ncbi:MAG: GNAT family N-acetyltransferase [Pyrinomonadaceae bacterium]
MNDVSHAPAKIRPASAHEAALLTELALRSKAHHGYDEEFIKDCRAELTLTHAYIFKHRVRVAETQDGAVVGFYTLLENDDLLWLDHLYVEPEMIGRGYGKLLWRHAVEEAKASGHRSLRIESDPHAEKFYLAMGAQRIGERASSVRAGRLLPLMHCSLD